jgi:hypothetical protein
VSVEAVGCREQLTPRQQRSILIGGKQWLQRARRRVLEPRRPRPQASQSRKRRLRAGSDRGPDYHDRSCRVGPLGSRLDCVEPREVVFEVDGVHYALDANGDGSASISSAGSRMLSSLRTPSRMCLSALGLAHPAWPRWSGSGFLPPARRHRPFPTRVRALRRGARCAQPPSRGPTLRLAAGVMLGSCGVGEEERVGARTFE